MNKIPSLNFNQRRLLVEALLACDCLRNQQSREQVLDDLPADVRFNITPQPSHKQDVDGIVRTCQKYPGALEQLLEVVHYNEGDSIPWKRIEEVIENILAATGNRKSDETHRFLPYLCNRSVQKDELRDALQLHKQTRPQRPLVCFIHGSERECHDQFLERLHKDIFPDLLQLKAALRECFWTEPPAPQSKLQKFWFSLCDKLLSPLPDSVEACGDKLKQELASLERPLFIQLQWLTENCADSNDLFNNFLQFWESWPDLPPNRIVICCVSVQYQQSKDTPPKFTIWKKQSPNDLLRRRVQELGGRSFEKVSLVVLKELQAISRGEAQDWAKHPKVRSAFQIPPEQIFAIYRANQDTALAMEELAPQLTRLLDGEPLSEPRQERN